MVSGLVFLSYICVFFVVKQSDICRGIKGGFILNKNGKLGIVVHIYVL